MSHAWMPLYVADYLADTGHLSTAEHGAYMLLILHYWQKGGLPNDDTQLARIARMSAKEWQASRPVIAAFFADNWRHTRVEDELAKADAIVAAKSDAGKLGAAKRWHSNGRANGKRMAEPMAEASISQWQTDAPSPSPLPKEDSSLGLKKKNGHSFDVAPVIKARSAEKSNYLWLKATDTRRANAEAWWQANYGHRDLPWQSNARGQVCRVPWEAVRYPIPPPAEPERVPLSG